MHPLLRIAGGICLPLWLSSISPAADAFKLPGQLSAEDFAKKVADSRQEALRRYPDLAKPETYFARAAKLIEENGRRDNPQDLEKHWGYPLLIAEETAKKLRVFSPLDPLYSEVVPIFTTKSGFRYAEFRVTKLRRDGIDFVHKGGKGFLHRDHLTPEQGSKYHSNWRTEVLQPDALVYQVDAAMRDRDGALELSAKVGRWNLEKVLAGAKFDFERDYHERGFEWGQVQAIRRHSEEFSLRLYELAYAAQDFGQREAMERIEKELREPVPEPYKTQLQQVDEKIKASRVLHEKIRALLFDKHSTLLRDGQTILEGVPERGSDSFGRGRLEILSPEHIRLMQYHSNNTSSHWVFKINLESGEATLLPEASKDNGGGTVSFRIAK